MENVVVQQVRYHVLRFLRGRVGRKDSVVIEISEYVVHKRGNIQMGEDVSEHLSFSMQN